MFVVTEMHASTGWGRDVFLGRNSIASESPTQPPMARNAVPRPLRATRSSEHVRGRPLWDCTVSRDRRAHNRCRDSTRPMTVAPANCEGPYPLWVARLAACNSPFVEVITIIEFSCSSVRSGRW